MTEGEYIHAKAIVLTLFFRGRLKTGSTPKHIEGKRHQRKKKHRANASVPETGEICHGITQAEPRIGHVHQQCPWTKRKKPIANGKVKGGGLGLGQETGHSLGFGTEQGETVFGIRQNNVEVRERGKEKQPTQVSNVVGTTPSRFQGLHLARWVGERGLIGLKTPPGHDDQQGKKEPRAGSPKMTQSPGDDPQESARGEDPRRVEGIAAHPLSETRDQGRQDRPFDG